MSSAICDEPPHVRVRHHDVSGGGGGTSGGGGGNTSPEWSAEMSTLTLGSGVVDGALLTRSRIISPSIRKAPSSSPSLSVNCIWVISLKVLTVIPHVIIGASVSDLESGFIFAASSLNWLTLQAAAANTNNLQSVVDFAARVIFDSALLSASRLKTTTTTNSIIAPSKGVILGDSIASRRLWASLRETTCSSTRNNITFSDFRWGCGVSGGASSATNAVITPAATTAAAAAATTSTTDIVDDVYSAKGSSSSLFLPEMNFITGHGEETILPMKNLLMVPLISAHDTTVLTQSFLDSLCDAANVKTDMPGRSPLVRMLAHITLEH